MRSSGRVVCLCVCVFCAEPAEQADDLACVSVGVWEPSPRRRLALACLFGVCVCVCVCVCVGVSPTRWAGVCVCVRVVVRDPGQGIAHGGFRTCRAGRRLGVCVSV